MSEQKIQIELTDTNQQRVKHFWLGTFATVAVFLAWWNGWFSWFAVETGVESPSSDGMQSTGPIGVSIDTMILIGSMVAWVWKFAKPAGAMLLEGIGATQGTLYQWFTQSSSSDVGNEKLTEAILALDEAIETHGNRIDKLQELTVALASRVNAIDAKTKSLPEPPKPKTSEQLLAEKESQLAALRRELEEKQSQIDELTEDDE